MPARWTEWQRDSEARYFPALTVVLVQKVVGFLTVIEAEGFGVPLKFNPGNL